MSCLAYLGFGYLIDDETAKAIPTFDDTPFFVVYNVGKANFLFYLDSLISVEQNIYDEITNMEYTYQYRSFMQNFSNFSMFPDTVINKLRSQIPCWYLAMN